MHYFPELFSQGTCFLQSFPRTVFGSVRAKLRFVLVIHTATGKERVEPGLSPAPAQDLQDLEEGR